MMKLSGTAMLEDTVPGMDWPDVLVVVAGIGMGRSSGGVLHRGRRAVLALVAEHVEARAARGVLTVAELVENVRAELDRVGAAELLLREPDRELGGQSPDAVDRRSVEGSPA